MSALAAKGQLAGGSGALLSLTARSLESSDAMIELAESPTPRARERVTSKQSRNRGLQRQLTALVAKPQRVLLCDSWTTRPPLRCGGKP